MAGYGTCRTYAELLGFDDHMDLLQQTLNEEEETDQLLTEIALTSVNLAAMGADDDEDGGDASDEGEEGAEDAAPSSSAGRSKTAGKTAGKTPAKKSTGNSRTSSGGSKKSRS